MSIQLHTVPQSKTDNQIFSESLKATSWTMWVEIIKKSTGIRNASDLLNKQSALPDSSYAHSVGNRTIFEFITKPVNENGLGIKWIEWEEKCTALQYKYRFSLIESDYKEILNKIDLVKSMLGRMPKTTSELGYFVAKRESKPSLKAEPSSVLKVKHDQAVTELNRINKTGSNVVLLPNSIGKPVDDRVSMEENTEKSSLHSSLSKRKETTSRLINEIKRRDEKISQLKSQLLNKVGLPGSNQLPETKITSERHARVINNLQNKNKELELSLQNIRRKTTTLQKLSELQTKVIKANKTKILIQNQEINNANTSIVILGFSLLVSVMAYTDMVSFNIFFG